MEMILYYFSLSLLSCWLLELGCGRFLFSGCNLWADVCCGVNLPVHIFKCQLWLLSQGWRAKLCPFSSSDCRRLQSDKNLTHSAVGPRWRSGLRSLPSVSPHPPPSLSPRPRCLPPSEPGCPSVQPQSQVGEGSCHVPVSWSVTFVTCHPLSHPPCLLWKVAQGATRLSAGSGFKKKHGI